MCKTAKIAIHNVLGTKNVNNINHDFNYLLEFCQQFLIVLNLWK